MIDASVWGGQECAEIEWQSVCRSEHYFVSRRGPRSHVKTVFREKNHVFV